MLELVRVLLFVIEYAFALRVMKMAARESCRVGQKMIVALVFAK